MCKKLCILAICLLALPANIFGAEILRSEAGPEIGLQPLLLEIDESLAVGSPILTEIHVDGSLVFTEEAITLGTSEEAGTLALPILASSPSVQEGLVAMASDRGTQVTVRVVSGDQVLTDVDLGQLSANTEALVATGARMVGLRFVLEDIKQATAPPENGGSCELQCEIQWIQCLNQNGCQIPLQGGPATNARGETQGLGCGQCNSQYNTCLNNCNPPPCPTVTYPTSTVFLGYTPLGGAFCYNWSFDGGLFQFSQATYQITDYRRTVNCDGSVTLEVLQVTSAYSYCYHYLGYCSYPFGYAPAPICF